MASERAPAADHRYEIKYILDPVQALDFESWALGQPFMSRAYPSRQVNSIYFDTRGLETAEDNLRGIANRKKFRIRWYGNADNHDSAPVTFEIKIKTGRLGRKLSCPLEFLPHQFLDMNERDRQETFRQIPAMAALIPPGANLIPTLYVSYHRHYLKGPQGIRLTLDKEIAFADMVRGAVKADPFPGIRTAYTKAIAEFKFPPAVKDEAAEYMSGLPLYPTRSSKYVIGLSLFGHVVYL
jgi:hypothetical protein